MHKCVHPVVIGVLAVFRINLSQSNQDRNQYTLHMPSCKWPQINPKIKFSRSSSLFLPFSELHLTAKFIVCGELPKHQRDLNVERYHSGEGYNRISKGLNQPWNRVKTLVIKWRDYGATVTLPKTVYPSNIDIDIKLVREDVRKPTATEELQEFLASTDYVVHVTTISSILHMSLLWKLGLHDWSLSYEEKPPSAFEVAQMHGEKVLWSDEIW